MTTYTHSQIHSAMLQAAAHIETHPYDYQFLTNRDPLPGIRQGCILGWIGYFLGVEPTTSTSTATFAHRTGQALGLIPSDNEPLMLALAVLVDKANRIETSPETVAASSFAAGQVIRALAKDYEPVEEPTPLEAAQ